MAPIHRVIFIDPGTTDIERQTNRFALRLHEFCRVMIWTSRTVLTTIGGFAALYLLVAQGLVDASWAGWQVGLLLAALIIAGQMALAPVEKRVKAATPKRPAVQVLHPSHWWIHDLRGQDAGTAFELLQGIRYGRLVLKLTRLEAANGRTFILKGSPISEDEAAATLDSLTRALQELKIAGTR